MTYKVFISHSSVDTWVAKQIARRIEEAGASYFLDAHDIRKGDTFEEEIKKGIRASQEALILLTPWALESRYIWMEIGAFWISGKRIVPVLYRLTVSDLTSDPHIPVFLKSADVVQINQLDETYFRELANRVGEVNNNG